MSISDYHATAANWRLQLRRNQKNTRLVIFCFIFIYVAIGLLVDMVMMQSVYPRSSLSQDLFALLSFQAVPYATIAMGFIAMLSILISYSFYDKIMLLGTSYKEITPQTASTLQEKQLYNVVEEMKVAAGLQFIPKVFVIDANYMNAFASGYSEKSAMVAITRGLIEKLDRAELQAVMAHELSHIRHLDIKLTLMVAILSNIMLLVVDMLFYSVLYRRDNKGDNRLVTIIILLRYLLPVITILLALFLSRTREYMADAGCVELMRNNEPLARALLKISQDHESHAEEYVKEYGETAHEQIRQASYLFDPSEIDPVKSLSSMFSTHPDMDKRLEALGYKKKK